jgi:hypothetical protein
MAGSPERFCPRCGAPARRTARFCGKCRAELRQPAHSPTASNPPFAARPHSQRASAKGPGLASRIRWTPVAVTGLLLLVLSAGVGAYVIVGRGSPLPTGRSGVAVDTPSNTVASPTPDTTPTLPFSTVPPTPAAEGAVLASVQGHWDAIRDHRFEEAYAYLGPNLATGQSAWVSSHQRDLISDVQYHFIVRDVNGDVATVDVQKLQTRAQSAQSSANPEGCLIWTGTYVLIKQGDRWVINQANVASRPC